MKMSSGVAFNPEGRYWRIGGEWYDFVNFSHPGGNEIIRLCRDRFDDATYAFEAHHMDYKKARAIIGKYRVGEGLQKVLKEVSQRGMADGVGVRDGGAAAGERRTEERRGESLKELQRLTARLTTI